MRKTLAIIIIASLLCISCGQSTKKDNQKPLNTETFEKGTFGYDLQFLKSKDSVIVLTNGNSQVIVSPNYQGKVFTSTATGLSGISFGWINYKALGSDTLSKHINAYGGEDRLWLGPEGGQFSIFFKKGNKMVFDNWQTPAGIDSEAWQLVSKNTEQVEMSKTLQLVNFSGTTLIAGIKRKVRLISANEMMSNLAITVDSELKWVGFETENTLTNAGKEKWSKEKGSLCLWTLGMFNPSDSGMVVIPYVEGDEKKLGKIVTTNYFSEIPADRIKAEKGTIFFKADGKFRSKIGFSFNRSTTIAGSYDALRKVLTIIKFNKPKQTTQYINQLWEMQKEPFAGDVINAYNDGPLKDGGQIGPFFELETSSPAAFLSSGEQLSHIQQIYHFVGDEQKLTDISTKLLGVSIAQIKNALN